MSIPCIKESLTSVRAEALVRPHRRIWASVIVSTQANQIDAIRSIEFRSDSIDDSSCLAVGACTSFDSTNLGARGFECPVTINGRHYVPYIDVEFEDLPGHSIAVIHPIAAVAVTWPWLI